MHFESVSTGTVSLEIVCVCRIRAFPCPVGWCGGRGRPSEKSIVSPPRPTFVRNVSQVKEILTFPTSCPLSTKHCCGSGFFFLGLPDQDPLVVGTDPALDPDLLSSCKNSKKNRDSYCFVTSLWLFICENYVNVPSKSTVISKKT